MDLRNHAIGDQAEAAVAFLAMRLTSLAETMQIIPAITDTALALNVEGVRRTLSAFAAQGIARNATTIGDHPDLTQISKAITAAISAIEESPLPQQEWRPMIELFGDELEDLVGASSSSIHRYRTGERPTPDHIAARLHTLTLIVADLAGSYNGFGIRRWFGRARVQLDGHSPAHLLKGEWDPTDENVVKVRNLAAALIAPLSA
jgi:hypothetical protein